MRLSGKILKNVNKIFLPVESTNSHTLDMDRYALIEKKLNLPKNNLNNVSNEAPVIENTITPPVTLPELTDTTVNVKTPELPTKKELDLKSISINIINAAKKSGVASSLSKTLEAAGFSPATTTDASKIQTGTTISIKKSRSEYNTFVEEVVKTTYPKTTIKTNPENSKFDVVISIGR